MQIPFFSHTREFEAHREEFLTAIEECLRSPTLVLGEHVRRFEEQFAASCGCRYGVGVASGTDALALALRALGISAGDEVVTVANTAVPTVAAIRMAGALPRLVDIDPVTFLMDLATIEGALTRQTKALLPVHLFGNPVPMTELMELAEKHHLAVVEDCAQAYGTLYEGKPVGGFGDIGCFSFYPTKNLGAWGDGGICVTNDKELAEKLHRLRSYGYREPHIAEEEGVNSRLDELQAAILLVKMRFSASDVQRRQEIAKIYDQALQGTSLLPQKVTVGGKSSYHLYVVQAPDREHAGKLLEQQGITTLVHYPLPIHLMKAYEFLGYKTGSLPVTEEVMRHILSIPLFPTLTDEEVEYVTSALQNIS